MNNELSMSEHETNRKNMYDILVFILQVKSVLYIGLKDMEIKQNKYVLQ